MLIDSGLGNGKVAGVDDDNRLLTASFNIPFEHLIAKDYAKGFTASGSTTVAAGTESVLVIRNNNQDQIVVPTKLGVQAVGITAGAGEYFTVELGGDYTSGGVQTTPVNTTSGSSVVSNVSAYHSNPTVAAGAEAWRLHPPANVPIEFTFNGGLLIPPSQTIIIKYTGAGAATIVANMAFSVVSTSDYSG